jgi:ketosteroid isomerase-like protein
MSQENVERLREAYELVNNEFDAMKQGDLDALLGFFDPEVVIEYVDAPDPERYEGHEGVRKWFHDSFGVWESVSMEAEEFIEAGDWTVVQLRGRVRGEKSGAELDVRLTATHRFRDGKIVHDRVYLDRGEALKAAGLRE